MKNIFFPLAMLMLMLMAGGCATKFEMNPNYATSVMEQNLKRDESFCHSYSRGVTAIPPMDYSYIPDQKINYSGIINTQRGSYNYSGTGYIDNSYARSQQGAENLGFAIGYAISVTRKENQCMKLLGWEKEKDLSEVDVKRIKFNEYWKRTYDRNANDPLREKIFLHMKYWFNEINKDKVDSYEKTIASNGASVDRLYLDVRDIIVKLEGEKVSGTSGK